MAKLLVILFNEIHDGLYELFKDISDDRLSFMKLYEDDFEKWIGLLRNPCHDNTYILFIDFVFKPCDYGKLTVVSKCIKRVNIYDFHAIELCSPLIGHLNNACFQVLKKRKDDKTTSSLLQEFNTEINRVCDQALTDGNSAIKIADSPLSQNTIMKQWLIDNAQKFHYKIENDEIIFLEESRKSYGILDNIIQGLPADYTFSQVLPYSNISGYTTGAILTFQKSFDTSLVQDKTRWDNLTKNLDTQTYAIQSNGHLIEHKTYTPYKIEGYSNRGYAILHEINKTSRLNNFLYLGYSVREKDSVTDYPEIYLSVFRDIILNLLSGPLF